MVTLYKRATPSQARILRAIEGAVKNVSDAHGIAFDPRHARSIAKRACGTLTSQWGAVLAATKMPSNWGVQRTPGLTARSSVSQLGKGPSLAQLTKQAKRARPQDDARLRPLRKLEKLLFTQMRAVKNSGNVERAEAFIYVLRQIAKIRET